MTPDVLTLAKPLAGGFPMGAVVASTEVATSLHPGDHATTFGGGPLIASVAAAVVRTVAEPDFLEAVREKGTRLADGLRDLGHGAVEEVRGRGLMQGLVLRDEAGPVGPVVSRAQELGLLLVSAGPRVVRFVPPLTVSEAEIDEAVAIVGEALP